jgi:peptidoglycan hydrolase-like amidase
MRKAAVALILLLASGRICTGQDVCVRVLSRFHPRELELRASRSEAVLVAVGDQSFVLDPGLPDAKAVIETDGTELAVTIQGRVLHARELHAAGRRGAANLLLSVPGKVSRRYLGNLAITAREGELAVLVTMDLETAVASVVQAESIPGTPLEALKAQAVVTRSYFAAAKGRHEGFAFCDLTHCQVLRDPPAPESSAARAARETRGLVLTYEDKPFATMFTRSCGGRTRTPSEAGLPVNGYPYFPVVCKYCHEHPFRWTRTLSREDAELVEAKGEAGRLAVDRRLGWNTVPSNNFTARPAGGQTVLEGSGQGHGIGLCQRGAEAMAAGGANFRDILSHYLPNTSVIVFRGAPQP